MGSPKAGKTNAQAKDDSRRELLDAGLALLTSGAPVRGEQRVNPMSHLKVRAVCDRAGRTSGAFYMHWPGGVEEYHRALGEYLLGEVAGMNDDLLELADVAREARDLGSPLAAITKVAREDLRLLLESDSWDAVERLTLAWGRDPGRLQQAAVKGYRAADDATAEAYGVLTEKYGLRPRDPLTEKDVAVLLQALIEGFGLRSKVDPDGVGGPDPGRLYAVGVAALLAMLTCGPEDAASVEDALAEALDRAAVPGVSS
jgi:AcrR family transcriptional regulator